MHSDLILTEDPNCIIDVGFVVDASGSVRDDWNVLLKFVTDVAQKINMRPGGSHIGLVYFGDNSAKVFDFNIFDQTPYNEESILDQIRAIPRPGSRERTFINRGLRRANRELFRTQFGMRPEVRQVLCR